MNTKKFRKRKKFVNVNDFFKRIIIVEDNVKRSRYDNGIILMSIYDFLLDAYVKKYKPKSKKINFAVK